MKINQLCKFILHYLGSWRIFVWELGAILLGNLAHFHLGTWRKTRGCISILTHPLFLCS